MKKEEPLKPGYEWIYTAFITLKNGRRLYAYEKGLKAFRIQVKNKAA